MHHRRRVGPILALCLCGDAIAQQPKDLAQVEAAAAELQKAGRLGEALEAYRAWAAKNPKDVAACAAMAGFLMKPIWNGQPRFAEGIAQAEHCVTLEPGNSTSHVAMATMYWDRAYKDEMLGDDEKNAYADAGLRHLDAALKVNPKLIDAMVYKGLLLRIKAMTAATSSDEQKAYLAEATALQAKALEMRKSGQGEMSGVTPPAPPPPPPPPPVAPPPPAPIRVGGEIKEPARLKNVDPVYPEIAKAARVQGIVILECTISPEGKVSDTRILRSIPLLDAAAQTAVSQWEYTTTLLNGVPVPVIMTVTVNFSLR